MMTIRRVNDNTVNCIITQEDLRENGIGIGDLFSRKREALEYIRSVIAQAASSENMNFSGDHVSMRLSVLPDHSISLTLSSKQSMLGNEAQNAEENAQEGYEAEKEYHITFREILDAARYSRSLSMECLPPSGLYYDPRKEVYILCIEDPDGRDANFERAVLSANEFGNLQTVPSGTRAYVREHCRTVLEEDALAKLAAL